MEAEVLKRINRGIILRTGAYLTNDHFVISSGRHAREYVEKRLVTTEPAFTEGLGDIIAKHYAASPVDVVLTSGIGATILGHCVARAHPSRPKLLYAVKEKGREGKTDVVLPQEFFPFLFPESSTLIVEDILTTGSTIRSLIRLVEERGGRVVSYEITEKFVNRGPRLGEADYIFPLPAGAAFEDLRLEINGELVSGETLGADKARQIYEDIVRRHRDPALLVVGGQDRVGALDRLAAGQHLPGVDDHELPTDEAEGLAAVELEQARLRTELLGGGDAGGLGRRH